MQATTKRVLTKILTVTAADAVYTPVLGVNAQVRACTLVNYSALTCWVTVRITPSGGTAQDILYRKVLAGGEAWPAAGLIAQALNELDTIDFAAQTATSVRVHLTVTETTTS